MRVTAETHLDQRPWVVAAAILAGAVLALYLGLILSEGDNSIGSILPWASLMGLGVVAIVAALLIPDKRRARTVLTVAAVMYGALGIVSIFSIGIGFLVVAGLLTVAISKLA